jgi:hypothetical protein
VIQSGTSGRDGIHDHFDEGTRLQTMILELQQLQPQRTSSWRSCRRSTTPRWTRAA